MESPRTRHRGPSLARTTPAPIATIEIDTVTPAPHGFTLSGQGSDRVTYRVEMHFELPLDPRTRTVMGELLSQSYITVSRSDTPLRNS
jgi:hypothetical protein